MAEGRRRSRAEEVKALRLGVDLGLTLIDTAEMYGEGAAESLVGQAIEGIRDQVFLVSKVYPHNSGGTRLREACERSLRRLKVDTIDLYLLHWRGSTPLAETVAGFEQLQKAGKIRHWGVSNLDLAGMEELDRGDCAANQVLYNPRERGIEFDLLPWARGRGLPIMAYSPLGQGRDLLDNAALTEVARRHEASPAQVALAWVLRQPGIIAIPKSADEAHLRSNVSALDLVLTEADLATIDQAFPPPAAKQPLSML